MLYIGIWDLNLPLSSSNDLQNINDSLLKVVGMSLQGQGNWTDYFDFSASLYDGQDRNLFAESFD